MTLSQQSDTKHAYSFHCNFLSVRQPTILFASNKLKIAKQIFIQYYS
jgi:hypothetical protein